MGISILLRYLDTETATKIPVSCIVNAMATDDLAMWGASTSAAVVLTLLSHNNLASESKGLISISEGG